MHGPQEKAASPLTEYKASTELQSMFLQHSEMHVCPRDRVLFWRGDPAKSVYLLINGEVELLFDLSENAPIGFRAGSGSLIGLPAAFSNESYSMTAVVSDEAEFAVMGRNEFCQMIGSSPALSFDVLRILAGETRSVRTAISEAGAKRMGVHQNKAE
jgi:CRP-like cAMP-binding protein